MAYRACLTLGLIAAILPGATAQSGFDDALVGYAWTSISGDLQFDHLYSRAKGDITNLHSSSGVYTVRFHGVSTQGSYIPMASWAGDGTCAIQGYGSGLMTVPTFSTFRWGRINCFDDAGNTKNLSTSLMLIDEGSAGGDNPYLAFVDSQEAVPSGNFLDLSDEAGTYNPGGGTTTLTREEGGGQYNVAFNGLGAVMPAGITVHVIPYSGSARSCRVQDYTLHYAGSDNARVQIRCSALPGSGPLDTRFVMLLTSTDPTGGSAASAVVSSVSQSSSWITLSGSKVHNPHGQVQARWDDNLLDGGYQVRFEWPSDTLPGVAFASHTSGAVHACSNSASYRPPGQSEDYLYVNVFCRSHAGSSVGSAFHLLMTQVTHGPPPDLIFGDRFEP